MNVKRFSLLLLVFFFFGNTRPAGATQPNLETTVTMPGATWKVLDLDPYNGDVGRYASIALDPVTQAPYISYFNATTGRMAITMYNPAVGGCGPDDDWNCGVFGNSGRTTGQYNSIAVPKSGHFSVAGYMSSPAENFLYEGTIDSSSSSMTDLDWGGKTGELTGMYNSLKYDSLGNWFVAYYRALPTPSQLRFMYNTNGQPGNCGPGNGDQCDVIDSGTAVGMYAALDFNGLDVPYIAYAGVSGQLKLAHRLPNGSTGNCGPNQSWKCEVIDANVKVGSRIAFYMPKCFLICSDYARIAYYDATGETVKYAYPKTGGNCGPSANWQCDVIDIAGFKNTNFNIDNMGVSMAVHNGEPTIAYVNATGGANTVLKVAKPTTQIGNCGPSDLFYTWQCDTIDSGQRADGLHDVGAYPALAISPSGQATIAYYDATAGDLDLAQEWIQVFLPAAFH